MSFTRTWMRRLSVAGLSCRDLVMRVAVVLVLSVSVASAIADPLAQVAVAADMDDLGKMAFTFTPDLDPEDAMIPRAAGVFSRVACVLRIRGEGTARLKQSAPFASRGE